CLCFFFFSSRRRHTRFSRDWSSDVCSSDLTFEVLPKREGSHAAVETAVSESPDASGASAGGSHQAPPSTVRALRYIDDSTVKLEQVTGDWDKHLHRPTINQTLSRAAVAGTDLGRTFEHEGDLIILFG